MSTIMNHRVSVGRGGVRDRGLCGNGHGYLGENGFVKPYCTSGYAFHVPSAPISDPNSSHYTQKRFSAFLETYNWVLPPLAEKNDTRSCPQRWRLIYYLTLC